MKHICFDDGAIAELLSGREMQSVDFDEGAQLVRVLKGSTELFKGVGKAVVTVDSKGMFFLTPGTWKQKKYLVIDCETASLFQDLRDSETLTALQKTFRFCAKLWSGNSVFNNSELMIAGTSKSILFPLPSSRSAGFRIAVERDPMSERLERREMQGKFLLVYKSGFEGGNSETESPSLTNFKKVFEELPKVFESLPEKIRFLKDKQEGSRQLQLTETVLGEESSSAAFGVFLPLQEWMKRLSTQQRKFVQAPVGTAQRLIGAAGTGKTATLAIRSLLLLKAAEYHKRDMRALFITHSEATKNSILEMLTTMDTDGFHLRDPRTEAVTLSVMTLAGLCADTLRQSISDIEFVDRDAQDSKLLQAMYIEQCISTARQSELTSHSPHMSERFRTFFTSNIDSDLAELFQHEISVQIKGRAGESFDVYKDCPPLQYGLPIENEADKGFVYTVFRLYQDQLEITAQFDTDDVVISAVGQLDTPIWRRRRSKEGYDYICVDEAHLFNINELQVFHFFTRELGAAPISFAIDRAQAVGDRGWNDNEIDHLDGSDVAAEETRYGAVFRSSANIVDFSASILASGSNLFTNFSNSLIEYQSGLTGPEEALSQPVRYFEASSDQHMVELAFQRADALQRLTQSKPWEILITTLSVDIAEQLVTYATDRNKAVTLLKKRGDYTRVKEASKSGHMIVGHADYVGGLEFNVVVIVGVDKGRVPLESKSADADTRNFARYAAHNRLYVAASRARLGLELIGVKGRGPSDLLDAAFKSKLLS